MILRAMRFVKDFNPSINSNNNDNQMSRTKQKTYLSLLSIPSHYMFVGSRWYSYLMAHEITRIKLYTLYPPVANIDPEKLPSPKERSLPTTIF